MESKECLRDLDNSCRVKNYLFYPTLKSGPRVAHKWAVGHSPISVSSMRRGLAAAALQVLAREDLLLRDLLDRHLESTERGFLTRTRLKYLRIQ